MIGRWASIMVSPGVRCDRVGCKSHWIGGTARVWIDETQTPPMLLCESCKVELELEREQGEVEGHSHAAVVAAIETRTRRERRRTRLRAAKDGD